MSYSPRITPREVIHHTLQGTDGGAPSTAVNFYMDGLIVNTASTVNPGFRRAVKALGVWLNTGTAGVSTAGNWTLGLHLNRSAVASASFTFNPTTANDVFSGDWSSQLILQPTDQYHLYATGPGRTLMFIRAILEFEVF